jgi:hypothetical protein
MRVPIIVFLDCLSVVQSSNGPPTCVKSQSRNSRVTSPATVPPALPESLLPRAPPPSRAPQHKTTDGHRARICFIALRLCTLCFYFSFALTQTHAHTRTYVHTRTLRPRARVITTIVRAQCTLFSLCPPVRVSFFFSFLHTGRLIRCVQPKR